MADRSVLYRSILNEQPVQRRYKYLNVPLERLRLQERARGGSDFLCKYRRVRPCVFDFESNHRARPTREQAILPRLRVERHDYIIFYLLYLFCSVQVPGCVDFIGPSNWI